MRNEVRWGAERVYSLGEVVEDEGSTGEAVMVEDETTLASKSRSGD